MIKRLAKALQGRLRRGRARWRRTMEGRAMAYFRDACSDYWETIKEVAEEKTFAQLMAALSFMLFVISLHLILWVIVCAGIGFLITLAWNHSLFTLAPYYFPSKLTFIQGWALSFLTTLLFFRNIRIELNTRKSSQK